MAMSPSQYSPATPPTSFVLSLSGSSPNLSSSACVYRLGRERSLQPLDHHFQNPHSRVKQLQTLPSKTLQHSCTTDSNENQPYHSIKQVEPHLDFTSLDITPTSPQRCPSPQNSNPIYSDGDNDSSLPYQHPLLSHLSPHLARPLISQHQHQQQQLANTDLSYYYLVESKQVEERVASYSNQHPRLLSPEQEHSYNTATTWVDLGCDYPPEQQHQPYHNNSSHNVFSRRKLVAVNSECRYEKSNSQTDKFITFTSLALSQTPTTTTTLTPSQSTIKTKTSEHIHEDIYYCSLRENHDVKKKVLVTKAKSSITEINKETSPVACTSPSVLTPLASKTVEFLSHADVSKLTGIDDCNTQNRLQENTNNFCRYNSVDKNFVNDDDITTESWKHRAGVSVLTNLNDNLTKAFSGEATQPIGKSQVSNNQHLDYRQYHELISAVRNKSDAGEYSKCRTSFDSKDKVFSDCDKLTPSDLEPYQMLTSACLVDETSPVAHIFNNHSHQVNIHALSPHRKMNSNNIINNQNTHTNSDRSNNINTDNVKHHHNTNRNLSINGLSDAISNCNSEIITTEQQKSLGGQLFSLADTLPTAILSPGGRVESERFYRPASPTR